MIRIRMTAALAAIVSLSILAGCSKETVPAETSAGASDITVTEGSLEETSDTSSGSEPTGEDNGSLLSGHVTFELDSVNLKDGVWDNVISNTDAGENKSPELKWEPVDGAKLYVIYMVDPDGGNWLHWKSDGVTETDLPEGWASSMEYVGPYPPLGTTHTYDVYVVALKKPVERLRGLFNGSNMKFHEFIKGLDTDAEGGSGNIISYGYLSGTFTSP